MLPFARVSIIGLGLIGSSIARAVRAQMPGVVLTGHDVNAGVRETVRDMNLLDDVTDTPGAAVIDAELVILCVPVGIMGEVAASLANDLPPEAIVTPIRWPAPSEAGPKRALPGFSTIAGASLPHLRDAIRRRSPSFRPSGNGWAPMWKSWPPSITISFSPLHAICRI